MSRRAGKPLFNFRDDLGSSPSLGKRAVASTLPSPSGDRAHLSHKLISEASRVLDEDELAEFESVIRGVRG